MSTKCKLVYGDNFYLYQELFDPDCVYLRLTCVDFEASKNSVTVHIPKKIWDIVRSHSFDPNHCFILLDENGDRVSEDLALEDFDLDEDDEVELGDVQRT